MLKVEIFEIYKYTDTFLITVSGPKTNQMYILLYQELFITVETTSVPDFDILESFLSDFGNLPGNRCGNENVSNVGEGVAEPLGGVFLDVWHQVAHERTARVNREPDEQEETQTMREIRSHIQIATRVHLIFS